MILPGRDFFCKRSPSPASLQENFLEGRDWGKVFLLEKKGLSPKRYPRKTDLDRRRGFLEIKAEFITAKEKK